MLDKRIFVFDTTLRDGEQSPGAAMTPEEKFRMARQLEKLGVDIIEAGFPAASDGEFRAVHRIAKEIRTVQIAAITRAKIADIDRTWEAIKDGADPRIHIILSSSDIHLKYQLKKNRRQIITEACEAVAHARRYTDNVEFSPMDATRADKRFLCRLLEWVIASGAKTVNIADTVGYTVPTEFAALIDYIFSHVENLGDHILSVHCHNDLGLATANTLAAVERGVRQVKCTMNGIGERAGNAALEEVVMALQTRHDHFALYTGIRTEAIYETSRLLTEITGLPVQVHKAIVGANAFAHEAGIHQDGLIKDTRTYEIMSPQSVGAPESRMVLGKHSGRHAVRQYLEKHGWLLTIGEMEWVFKRFKILADSRKHVSASDLEAIVAEGMLKCKRNSILS